MKVPFLILLLLFTGRFVDAQPAFNDSTFILPDTVRPFTLDNLYQLVIRYHPVAKQADLLSAVGKQEIRFAKGNFDPKLESTFSLKHYNDVEYYRLFDGSLKFPTRSPISPTVGIARNTGENLNPENYISNEYNFQQLYAGVSIPIAQGFITDERRTALKQAELFSGMMEAEQIKIINDLLLDATKDYWQWYYAYYNHRLASNTVGVAKEIFRRVKMNFEGGEVAVLDTVQARITLLEREVSLQEAYVQLQNSTLKLSTYLWDSVMNPVDLTLQYAPEASPDLIILSKESLAELMEAAKVNHPELRKQNLKLQQLAFEKRLASEYLKPKLDLTYYFLNQPINPEGVSRSFTLQDNYKFGVDFSIPIFLRKERAKLAQTKLNINTTTFDRDFTRRKIMNGIEMAYNQLVNNGVILRQQRTMVDNYSRLMAGELINLENGESDLFKINVQQEKLFNAQTKFIKMIAEYENQKALLYWSAGVGMDRVR